LTGKERSYLVPGLTIADRKLLEGVPRKATLADEIAYLRLRISHLVDDGEEVDDQLLLRMLALLTRMVGVQAKLGEDGPDELALIADRARQRLVAAGLLQSDADA
jgi:hypothetical protein